jgi:hypothetical protein
MRVRIDGQKVGVNDYEKPDRFVNGQDIGVPWPHPWPNFGERQSHFERLVAAMQERGGGQERADYLIGLIRESNLSELRMAENWIRGPRYPEGPKIAQSWYEVQPGTHQLELAENGWFIWQVRGSIDFSVEPDGVYTVSCQWQNHPRFHLILIRGEDVVMDPTGLYIMPG